MPNITEYNAPAGLGLHPEETGISAIAAAARRVGGDYNEAAQAKAGEGQMFGSAIQAAGNVAVKYEDHRQISQGAVQISAIADAQTKAWNNTYKNSDPNDPSVAPTFMKGLEDQLQKFSSTFTTERSQEWAQGRVDALRNHFNTMTTADLTRGAGERELINDAQTLNHNANMVRGDPTPESLKLAVSNWDAKIASSKTNLTNATPAVTDALNKHAENGKAILARNYISGLIEKDPGSFNTPDQIRARLEKEGLDKYITGDQVNTMAKAAQYYERLAQSNARTNRIMERQDNEQAAIDRRQEIIGGKVDADGNTVDPGMYDSNGNISVPQDFEAKMLKEPAFQKPGMAKYAHELINLAHRKPVRADTPGYVTDILNRFNDPNTDPKALGDEIVQARGQDPEHPEKKYLTHQTASELLGYLKDNKRSEVQWYARELNAAKAKFQTGMGGVMSAQAGANMRDMEADAYRKWQAAQRGGRPETYLDPGSPGYLFKDEFLNSYIHRRKGGGGNDILAPPTARGTPARTRAPARVFMFGD